MWALDLEKKKKCLNTFRKNSFISGVLQGFFFLIKIISCLKFIASDNLDMQPILSFLLTKYTANTCFIRPKSYVTNDGIRIFVIHTPF